MLQISTAYSTLINNRQKSVGFREGNNGLFYWAIRDMEFLKFNFSHIARYDTKPTLLVKDIARYDRKPTLLVMDIARYDKKSKLKNKGF